MYTPEQIAKLMKEDTDLDADALVEDEQGDEPGDMRVIHDMATQISRQAQELVAASKKGNIRSARAIIGEIGGALEQASLHANRLARERGLSDLKPQNNT